MFTNAPIPITTTFSPGNGALLPADLHVGQRVSTLVQGQSPQLFLMLSGLRIPLDAQSAAALAPGQSVWVEILQGKKPGQFQVRVSPQPQSSAPPASSAASGQASLMPMLNSVLDMLEGALSERDAVQLLPRQLPQEGAVIRQLFNLFTQQGKTGADLQSLALTLADAHTAGALDSSTYTLLLNCLGEFQMGDEKNFRKALSMLGKGQSLEGFLAKVVADTATLDEATLPPALRLLITLGRLQQDEDFQQYLLETQKKNPFDQVVQRITERLDGGQWQNLRNQEQPYLFLELPLPPGEALYDAQLHFFADGHASKQRFDKKNATVVLDITLTRLGPLWITFHVSQNQCQCHFRATQPDIVALLEGNAQALSKELAEVGYVTPHIRVSLWDGDRVQACVRLMQRFKNVNLQA